MSYRDVDFFLLDDRFYRNSDKAPDSPEKTMLGKQQLAWLKDALLRSKASFKIIANGSQMLNQHRGKEGWHHFPHERAAFLEWLDETGSDGVMFISGDVHYSALTRFERKNSYPLYDLSCSPLTSGARSRALDVLKLQVVEGTFVGERNFCQLDFSGPRKSRKLTITVMDADGMPVWSRDINSSELRSRHR